MLTDEELMLLVQLEYLEAPVEAAAGITIEEAAKASVAGIVLSFDETALKRLAWKIGGMPSGLEWTAILRAIRENERLMALSCFGKDDQVYASCYVDDAGEAYVTFRGTSTGEEWIDNVVGSFAEETKSQKEALAYVEALPFDKMTVAGHSKGGNKAQYVTLLSGKVDRCVSMDGQGFSREFLEKYSTEISANCRKIRNYSLATDYVHVNLLEVPGADQIYCQGDWRLAGIRNHSSAAFYQFYRDRNGDLRIVLNAEGQTNLIFTTENEGVRCLRDYTKFLLDRLPDDRREKAIHYLGNILALAMRKDFTVSEDGEMFSHENLRDYLFSDQETAALFLAYLLKYAEEKELSESQFLALLEAFGLRGLYMTLKGLTHHGLRPPVFNQGKFFRDYLLKAIREPQRNLIIENSLGMLYRLWLRRPHIHKRNRRVLDPQKLWRDIQREYLDIDG
ncbi:MAG: Mbeg1-like protein [bacterium]